MIDDELERVALAEALAQRVEGRAGDRRVLGQERVGIEVGLVVLHLEPVLAEQHAEPALASLEHRLAEPKLHGLAHDVDVGTSRAQRGEGALERRAVGLADVRGVAAPHEDHGPEVAHARELTC